MTLDEFQVLLVMPGNVIGTDLISDLFAEDALAWVRISGNCHLHVQEADKLAFQLLSEAMSILKQHWDANTVSI